MTILIEQMALNPGGPTAVVKDTIDIAGYPTRAASRALAEAPPASAHAAVVEGLLAAGFEIRGKANLHELAFGTTGINNWTGTPANPRYPGRIPGGSSSGSAAAVAAGLAEVALGTDTGGSVRIPACCCGVFGFKPTFGRVSREGVMPTRSSLDCVGPFAADLAMLTRAMRAIDKTFGALPEMTDVSLGVVPVSAHPEIHQALEQALASSGFVLGEAPLPGMQAAYQAGMVVINRETFQACEGLLASGLVGEDVAGRLRAAGETSDAALAEAEAVRQAFTAEVDAALQCHPVLALPTMPDYPLRLDEAADTRAVLGMTAFVRPFNLSGHPALSIPLEGAAGLPVGLQLVAAKGADELLFAVAQALIAGLESPVSDHGVSHDIA